MRSCSSVFAALATLACAAVAGAQQTGQEAVITGTVASAAGAPLPYASVFLKDLRVGVVTSTDGTYRLVVPAARVTGKTDSLTVRLIGYQEKSVALAVTAGGHAQNFVLEANPLRLGEVVVTGEGTSTTRERLGNVINTVDTSLIARSNESNVVSALAGKAPNVEVNASSGDPGSSSYIRIRGPKTITGTGQPLFVVDGVPIDNSTYSTEMNPLAGTTAPNRASDINPDDIASVEILKGAAAAAIYGARAGQGVVLITTKKGQSGQTRYSLTSSYSFDDVNKRIPLQRTFGHGSEGVFPSCDASNPDGLPVDSLLDCGPSTSSSFGPPLASGTPVFNHFNELFDTGHDWNSALSISGGNDQTLYYLSAGRDNDKGDIVGPNDWYDKTTVRLNASHRMFENLNVGMDVSYVNTQGHFLQQGSNVDGLLLGALRTPPEFDNHEFLDPTTGLQRSYRFPFPSINSSLDTRGYDNPFFIINEDLAQSQLNRTYGNVNASWDALDWLNFKETFGADYYGDERLEGFPQTSSGQPSGQVIRADFKSFQLDQNLTGTARHTFSPSLSGSLTVGQNINARDFRHIAVTGVTLVAPEPFALLNTSNWTPNDSESTIHSESYFGQVDLNLWDRLFLSGAARNDGFSEFGVSSRRHWFPKASLAYNFIQQNSGGNGLLDYGKFRFAYGETGTEPAVYSTTQFYAAGVFFPDAGWGSALLENQNGNGGLSQSAQKAQPNLAPERTKEFETGVDLGMFNNHADASVTLYQDRTEGAIFQAPLAASTGFVSQAQNAGTIRNRGIETSLNYRPIMNSDLTWEIGLQWSKNENRVLSLNGQQFVDLSAGGGGGFTGTVPTAWLGSEVGVLRGNDFARCGRGLNINGEDIDAGCGNAPKGALYIGADGFPVVDPTTRVIADGNPDWLGSLRTSVTYHKVTLSGLLDVKHGGQIWDGTRGALINFGTHIDTDIRGQSLVFGKTYMPGPVAGPGAGTPVVIDQSWFQGNGGGFGPVASQFVEPGGYTKLREISVAYSLDQDWVKSWGFSSIDLRLAGRNLYTWTQYRGIDPEANLAGAAVLIQGVDYFNNPQTRSFVISLGLNR